MEILVYLIPAALGLGLLGLGAFLWALSGGQFEDLDGAAHRVLGDDDEAGPDNGPIRASAPDPFGRRRSVLRLRLDASDPPGTPEPEPGSASGRLCLSGHRRYHGRMSRFASFPPLLLAAARPASAQAQGATG